MRTAFVLNAQNRIQSTREPDSTHGPLLALARGAESCAWAVRDDVPSDVAGQLDSLARCETGTSDLHEPPRHAKQYISLLRHLVVNRAVLDSKLRESDGPAFVFPGTIPDLGVAVRIEEEELLNRHLHGWLPGEIAAGRYPVMAVVLDGYPVSACCCARRSSVAAEAGVDTAAAYRRRGFGPIVTSAWARAVRAEGLTPLYSTAWTNNASLAVASKLGLVPYASTWKLNE